MDKRKKILLIATGGTIASRETEHGLAPSVSPGVLCRSVPEAADFCQLEAIQQLFVEHAKAAIASAEAE